MGLKVILMVMLAVFIALGSTDKGSGAASCPGVGAECNVVNPSTGKVVRKVIFAHK